MGCKPCNNNFSLQMASQQLEFKSNISTIDPMIDSHEEVEKLLHYMQTSDTLGFQRNLSIGPYFDKNSIQNKIRCLEQWTQNCDLKRSLRCVTQEEIRRPINEDVSRIERIYSNSKKIDSRYTIEKIQKAIRRFYKEDPNTFDSILATQGGGVIRWDIWKTKFNSQSKNYVQYLQRSEENFKWKSVIQKDILRTFPQQIYLFYISQSEKFFTSQECISNLSQMLDQISLVFPILGYHQAMNYIIAFILMVSGGNILEAWRGIIVLLTSNYWILFGLFLPEFPLYQMLTKLTRAQIQKKNIQLYNKMKELEIDDQLLLQKWIMTIYTYKFPLQVCLYLWDAIIAKGIWAIIDINVLLIFEISQEIINCKNLEEFMDLLERMSTEKMTYFSDYNKINTQLKQYNDQVKNQDIIICAKIIQKQVKNPDSIKFLGLFEFFNDQKQFKLEYEKFLSSRMNMK